MAMMPRDCLIHVADLYGHRAEDVILVWTGADGSRFSAGSRCRGDRQRAPKLDQLGRRGGRRLAAAGTRRPRAAARLGDSGTELGVDDQVEDEVEREVGGLQRVGDDDGDSEALAVSRSGRVEVEVDQLRRRDENKRHGNDADESPG